jgi:hypothetical protein
MVVAERNRPDMKTIRWRLVSVLDVLVPVLAFEADRTHAGAFVIQVSSKYR